MNTVPKKRWFRILPAVFLMYCINMIDRNNIGFAFPGMESDLGIGATYAGLAGGIFAIGYLFLQVPGGLWAERWSAKKTDWRCPYCMGNICRCYWFYPERDPTPHCPLYDRLC